MEALKFPTATLPWKYRGEELDHDLIAQVAQVLDLAGVPNIL